MKDSISPCGEDSGGGVPFQWWCFRTTPLTVDDIHLDISYLQACSFSGSEIINEADLLLCPDYCFAAEDPERDV
jgi:hypothetical protein